MVAVQIRDVPDGVRRDLADRAAAEGQSLQAFLLALLTAEAGRSANLAVLKRFAQRSDGSRLSTREATQDLDRARDERDSQLAEPSSPA